MSAGALDDAIRPELLRSNSSVWNDETVDLLCSVKSIEPQEQEDRHAEPPQSDGNRSGHAGTWGSASRRSRSKRVRRSAGEVHAPYRPHAGDVSARRHSRGAGRLRTFLDARALYLFTPERGDTFLRIHGTDEPETIGRAVSNGCARLVNDQMIELYDMVPLDTRVVPYRPSN